MAWFEHGPSRISYEVSGSGDPVLLLPGFSDSIEHHSALRERLAARYRVIAADLPGSGRSGPQPRRYTRRYFEDDAHAFIAMLSELGHHPAHLVGFSDGGEVALLVAALAPNMARSLVTWGATGFVSDPGGQLRASLRDIIDNPIPPMKGWSESLIATYGADNARAMMGSFLGAITEIIEDGGDISRSRANAISCPVLLIAGEHDVFAPPALVDELAARIAEAVVTVVPGVGHAVHDERPEWFRDTVLDWLAKPA